MSVCQQRVGPCSSCGQVIALCVEGKHQQNTYCKVATAARQVAARGLVRAPGDGLVPMLAAAGVPYEVHPTRTRSAEPDEVVRGARGESRAECPIICDEAWVPPEALAIVRTNRPLEDRMHALRKFAAWHSKHRSSGIPAQIAASDAS